MLIDSHCHLGFKDYTEDELLNMFVSAAQNEVTHLITIGAGEGFEGNPEAVRLAQSYPQVFATVGMHPHDAKLDTPAIRQQIKDWCLSEPRVVGVGEIGLDFHYEHSPREIQEKVLEDYIALAQEVNKPIIIHDRDAGDRTYEILKNNGVKEQRAVIHCFTGTLALAKKYLDLGYYISFSGIVTFKKAEDLRQVVREVPLTQMFLETDSPYLTPEPLRGKKNQPANVRYVAQKIAEVKETDFEEVVRVTHQNVSRFFDLSRID